MARELKRVPEPLLPGNHEGKSECMRGKSFRDIVIEQSVRRAIGPQNAAVHFRRAGTGPTREEAAATSGVMSAGPLEPDSCSRLVICRSRSMKSAVVSAVHLGALFDALHHACWAR